MWSFFFFLIFTASLTFKKYIYIHSITRLSLFLILTFKTNFRKIHYLGRFSWVFPSAGLPFFCDITAWEHKGIWNRHPWYKLQITFSLLLAVYSQINRNSWDLKIKSCSAFFFHSDFIDKVIILLHHFSKFRWKSINVDIWKWMC